MKDYIVIIILLFLFLFRSSDIEAQAFQARNVNFDLGYIFGSRAVYANFISPGAIISLQKGVYKWISVGAYAGVQQHLLGAPVTSTNNLDYTAVYAGVNGSFHFYQMISELLGKDIKADKLDIAIKHSFGVRLTFPSAGSVSQTFSFGISGNVRYFFTDYFGVYLEAGYPVAGLALAGIALKF